MSITAWVLVGLGAWVLVALAVALVLGRIVRLRDRQVQDPPEHDPAGRPPEPRRAPEQPPHQR